jgi:hypothetical protein
MALNVEFPDSGGAVDSMGSSFVPAPASTSTVVLPPAPSEDTPLDG